MSTNKAYDEIRADLKKEKAAISELERTIARRRQRVEKLETALEVLGEYQGDGEPVSLGDPDASLKDAVRMVLEYSNGPTGSGNVVDEIWHSEFQYDHDRDTLDRSIRGVLSRGVKSGDFVRVRRGIYGLPGRDTPESETPTPAATGAGESGE